MGGLTLRHEAASDILLTPPGRKGVGDDLPPAGWALASVVLAHARTLAFITNCIPTGRRAFFLRAIGLNDIDATEGL